MPKVAGPGRDVELHEMNGRLIIDLQRQWSDFQARIVVRGILDHVENLHTVQLVGNRLGFDWEYDGNIVLAGCDAHSIASSSAWPMLGTLFRTCERSR